MVITLTYWDGNRRVMKFNSTVPVTSQVVNLPFLGEDGKTDFADYRVCRVEHKQKKL